MVYNTIADRKVKVELTSKEYNMVVYFLENKLQSLSREQILNRIWSRDYYGTDRVVDDLIRRLRKKMSEFSIETVYGYGYRLVEA